MINTNRIVSVKQTDLLSLYGTMLKISGLTINSVLANGIGEFELASGSGNLIASEPVKTFDFGASVTSATLYFVADYNYKGFTVNGTAATIVDNNVAVEKDSCTLFKAVLDSGSITITKAGF